MTNYKDNLPIGTDIFRTAQVAEMLGVSARRVRAIARQRNLGRYLVGRLFFTADEVDNMRKRRPKAGRPPNKDVDETTKKK